VTTGDLVAARGSRVAHVVAAWRGHLRAYQARCGLAASWRRAVGPWPLCQRCLSAEPRGEA
jgi:hypothetical protein